MSIALAQASERPAKAASRSLGIDAMRVVAAFAVILIHTVSIPEGAPADLGGVLAQICHFAVPFYFVAAGYFLLRQDEASLPRLFRFLARMLPLYLFWLLLYVFLWGDVRVLLHPVGLARALVTGMPGYHLWFVPALISATILILLVRDRVIAPYLWAIAVSMYGAAMVLGPLWPLIAPQVDLPFSVRNGPITALIFVLAGVEICRRSIAIPIEAGFALLVVGIVLHLTENRILAALGAVDPNGNDFTLGTVAMGLGAFFVAAGLQNRGTVAALGRFGPFVLRIYLLHPLVVKQLQAWLPHVSLAERLLVAALTLIATSALVWLAARIPVAQRVLR